MVDHDKIRRLIGATDWDDLAVRQYRTGQRETLEVAHGVATLTIMDMPHIDTAPPESERFKRVDMIFFTAVVDMDLMTEERRALFDEVARELDAGVKEMAQTELHRGIAGGPSFMHLGALVDSQEVALLIMAIGVAIGRWRLMTAYDLLGQDEPRDMIVDAARKGFVMVMPAKETKHAA